jgi:drug/metabolite transporter (DMT)-like permease
MLTIVLALLAAASNACASVLQRKANLSEVAADRSGVAGLVDLVRQPVWLAGIGAVVLSFLLQAAALSHGELAVVQPLLALELPITLLLASRVFGRRMEGRTWADILVMTLGMAFFLFCLHPSPSTAPSPSGVDWALAGGAIGAVIVGLVVVAYLRSGALRAALLGIAAGISFALTATFMSGALAPGLSWDVLGRWQTWMVVVAGLTAMVLLQEGLRAGSLVVVQPGLTLVDPVVAVILGALLFDEPVRGGPWLIGEVAGALAVGWGALRLIRSPIVSDDDEGGAPDAARDGSRGRSGSGPTTEHAGASGGM